MSNLGSWPDRATITRSRAGPAAAGQSRSAAEGAARPPWAVISLPASGLAARRLCTGLGGGRRGRPASGPGRPRGLAGRGQGRLAHTASSLGREALRITPPPPPPRWRRRRRRWRRRRRTASTAMSPSPAGGVAGMCLGWRPARSGARAARMVARAVLTRTALSVRAATRSALERRKAPASGSQPWANPSARTPASWRGRGARCRQRSRAHRAGPGWREPGDGALERRRAPGWRPGRRGRAGRGRYGWRYGCCRGC